MEASSESTYLPSQNKRDRSDGSLLQSFGMLRLSVNENKGRSYSDTLSVASDERNERSGRSGGESLHLNAYELEENELPPQREMQDILNYYYEFIQPQDMILPPKDLFLKWVPLSSDSSVYHALIATICQQKPWGFSRSPRHWMSKMEAFWDNLSDYGMVVCMFLVCHIRDIVWAPQALMANMAKCWSIIQENYPLEALNKEKNLNARKLFERESLLRIIWSLSVGSLIYRTIGGYPFAPPQILGSGPITVEFLKEKVHFPLPAASMKPKQAPQHTRLSTSDYDKHHVDDIGSVILAVEHSLQVLDRIGKVELFLECEELSTLFSSQTYKIEKEHVIIDPCVTKALFIKLRTDLLQYEHLLKAGIFGRFSDPVTEKAVPEYKAFDLRQIQNESRAQFVGGLLQACRMAVELMHLYQGYTAGCSIPKRVLLSSSEKPLPEKNSWAGVPLAGSLCAHSLARAIPALVLFWETLGEQRKEAFGAAGIDQLQQWLEIVQAYLQLEAEYQDPESVRGFSAGMEKIRRHLELFRILTRGTSS